MRKERLAITRSSLIEFLDKVPAFYRQAPSRGNLATYLKIVLDGEMVRLKHGFILANSENGDGDTFRPVETDLHSFFEHQARFC